MATTVDFRRDIVPFLIATIGEFVALVLWLKYLDAGAAAQARAALWIGFAVERIAVAAWVRYVYAPQAGVTSGPIWTTAIFLFFITLAEVGIWDVWLDVSRSSGLVAGGALLFVLIHILHSLEMGAVKNRNPLTYARNASTLTFSIMEAVGGAGWLWLYGMGHPTLGATVLLVGLSIEHVVQGRLLKPQVAPVRTTIH
jgi:hypothetical protein